MSKKRLAIIPARGGSKGIPRKNIIDLCGKPLLAYSVEAGIEALNRGAIDKLIISTDDIEIAEVAKRYGAEVPFLRPESLASDKAKSVDLLIHAQQYYEELGIYFDDIILLQPTSPMRTGEDIIKSLEIYDSVPKADSLVSCFKEDYICDLVSYHKENNVAIPINPLHNAGIRRQEAEDLYVRNGAVYITNVKYLMKEKKVFGGNMAMYVMSKERSINIDTPYDLKLAAWAMDNM